MRRLHQHEAQVIATMLESNEEARHLLPFVPLVVVRELNDGGMGSLEFNFDPNQKERRQFGKTVATAEFIDSDGIPVSLEIYLDAAGNLYELDVWKVDSSPLIAWPDPKELKAPSLPNRLKE